MKPSKEETARLFRVYLTNIKPLYTMEEEAQRVTENLNRAIKAINDIHAPKQGGGCLIANAEDIRGAIAIYLDELRELVEFELLATSATTKENY